MTATLISFGSNLGGSEAIITDALNLLDSHSQISELQHSELVRTKPIGGPDGQPDFLNGVARFFTKLPPNELMDLLLETERHFGRKRRIRWDARVLDLDILLYGHEIRFDANCEIPHPRMTFRPFALEPAVEIAADMIHPVCGIRLSEILERLRTSNRTITFVGNLKSLKTIQGNLAARFPRWNFAHQSFCDFEEGRQATQNTKLSIFLLDNVPKTKFLTQEKIDAGRFASPILLLENAQADGIETETAAAIAAMDELD